MPTEVEKIRLFKLIDTTELPEDEVALIRTKPTTAIFAQYKEFAICICHLPDAKHNTKLQKVFLDVFLEKSASYLNPILCGDFNIYEGQQLLETIPYKDLDWPEYTYHDLKGKHVVYDRIYTNLPIELHPTELYGPAPNDRNPSDHYPIKASVEISTSDYKWIDYIDTGVFFTTKHINIVSEKEEALFLEHEYRFTNLKCIWSEKILGNIPSKYRCEYGEYGTPIILMWSEGIIDRISKHHGPIEVVDNPNGTQTVHLENGKIYLILSEYVV
jgi:hypothetical protein